MATPSPRLTCLLMGNSLLFWDEAKGLRWDVCVRPVDWACDPNMDNPVFMKLKEGCYGAGLGSLHYCDFRGIVWRQLVANKGRKMAVIKDPRFAGAFLVAPIPDEVASA